jgi:hypothetical protein
MAPELTCPLASLDRRLNDPSIDTLKTGRSSTLASAMGRYHATVSSHPCNITLHLEPPKVSYVGGHHIFSNDDVIAP